MNVRRIAPLLVALVVAATTSGCSETQDPAATGTTVATGAGHCDEASLVECARRSILAHVVPDATGPAEGEPILIGMVNQENTPAGSYPELSAAATAAVEFVNEELGGIHGRPIRLEVCNTEFSAEGSTSCGQRFVEEGAVAVLGGIDVFGNAIDVLDDNDIPYVGGIPVSDRSVTAPNSFQFSGGTWGAAVAFADHAVKSGAERVAVVYGDFGSIADAAEVGRRVLERSGAEVQMVPYPIIATDLSATLAAATADDPDAIFVLAADTGCRAGFDGLHALGVRATKYFVGACASPAITEQAGNDATEGIVFNVEGPVRPEDPSADQQLYDGVIAKYGSAGLDPIGAGTVSFRAFMNLYRILAGLDGDPAPAKVIAALGQQVGTPSFAGHPYTCDRQQFTDLPAMCAPQQILTEMHDGTLRQIGDWVDVGAIERG